MTSKYTPTRLLLVATFALSVSAYASSEISATVSPSVLATELTTQGQQLVDQAQSYKAANARYPDSIAQMQAHDLLDEAQRWLTASESYRQEQGGYPATFAQVEAQDLLTQAQALLDAWPEQAPAPTPLCATAIVGGTAHHNTLCSAPS
jgi:hypothetical protein